MDANSPIEVQVVGTADQQTQVVADPASNLEPVVSPVMPEVKPTQDVVSIWPESVATVSSDENTLTFAVNFNISIYDAAGKSKSGTFQKIFNINTQSAGEEFAKNLLSAKVTVVEEKKTKVEEKKSTATRMRELAGLPHDKNFI